MLKVTRLTRKQLILLVGLTFAIILSIIYAAFHNNLHEVIPNQVYRSAQMSSSDIQQLTHLKQIKTIINLRGVNSDTHWYQQEMEISHKLKLHHYDIALNAQKLPSHQQLLTLINLIEKAPKPILLHCQSGVDRSGFASALALILLKNAPLAKAEQQFSWRYFVTSDKTVGKLVFTRYKHWLAKHHLQSSKKQFISWAEQQS